MTDRRYEDDGGRPYVPPENPDAADEARELEDEREGSATVRLADDRQRLLREEIDNALEILDGYFEVNNGINEIGVAAMRLIQHAPEMLAALKLVSRKQTPVSWDAVAKAIRSATGGAA